MAAPCVTGRPPAMPVDASTASPWSPVLLLTVTSVPALLAIFNGCLPLHSCLAVYKLYATSTDTLNHFRALPLNSGAASRGAVRAVPVYIRQRPYVRPAAAVRKRVRHRCRPLRAGDDPPLAPRGQHLVQSAPLSKGWADADASERASRFIESCIGYRVHLESFRFTRTAVLVRTLFIAYPPRSLTPLSCNCWDETYRPLCMLPPR